VLQRVGIAGVLLVDLAPHGSAVMFLPAKLASSSRYNLVIQQKHTWLCRA